MKQGVSLGVLEYDTTFCHNVYICTLVMQNMMLSLEHNVFLWFNAESNRALKHVHAALEK